MQGKEGKFTPAGQRATSRLNITGRRFRVKPQNQEVKKKKRLDQKMSQHGFIILNSEKIKCLGETLRCHPCREENEHAKRVCTFQKNNFISSFKKIYKKK